MDRNRALGVAIFILGVAALGFAYHASDAPMDQLSNSLTGRYTDTTMTYFIVGIVAAIVGGFLVLSGRTR